MKNGGAAIPTPPTTTMDVLLTTLNQRQQQPAVINPFKEGETKRGNGEEEPALKDGTMEVPPAMTIVKALSAREIGITGGKNAY